MPLSVLQIIQSMKPFLLLRHDLKAGMTKGVTGMLAPLVACAAVRLGLIIRPTVPRTDPAGYQRVILATDLRRGTRWNL